MQQKLSYSQIYEIVRRDLEVRSSERDNDAEWYRSAGPDFRIRISHCVTFHL
jgi:hypothetical protein